ncbi:MAG: hypothetical protein ABIE23_00860 [archaeon]|nr:hypothetical protein [Candidatus Micrarchaeota archaeon]
MGKEKGYVFTLEALISLIILLCVIIAIPLKEEREEENILYITQLGHDLLKVWGKEGKFVEGEMKQDFELVFPSLKGEIEVNGKKIKVNGDGEYKNKLVLDGFYLREGNELNGVRLIVFH